MYQETKEKLQTVWKTSTCVAITDDGHLCHFEVHDLTGHFINEDWDLMNVGLQMRHILITIQMKTWNPYLKLHLMSGIWLKKAYRSNW